MEPSNQQPTNTTPSKDYNSYKTPETSPSSFSPLNDTSTAPVSPGTTDNKTSNKKVGPIMIVLVVVLAVIIVTLYLFASRLNEPNLPQNNNIGMNNTINENVTDQVVAPITDKADDIQSLEADLNKSIDGLDTQNF
jgi:uncharacterized protein HemX